MASQKSPSGAIPAGCSFELVWLRPDAILTTQHGRLTVISGELADESSVEQALSGATAVISALGPRGATKGMPVMHGREISCQP